MVEPSLYVGVRSHVISFFIIIFLFYGRLDLASSQSCIFLIGDASVVVTVVMCEYDTCSFVINSARINYLEEDDDRLLVAMALKQRLGFVFGSVLLVGLGGAQSQLCCDKGEYETDCGYGTRNNCEKGDLSIGDVPHMYSGCILGTWREKCLKCSCRAACNPATQYESVAPAERRDRQCAECANNSCKEDHYRSGYCDINTKGYTCNPCSNVVCGGDQYRAGECAGTTNGYTCDTHEPCPQDTEYIPSDAAQRECKACPAGYHQPIEARRARTCMLITTTTTTTTTTSSTSTTTTTITTTTSISTTFTQNRDDGGDAGASATVTQAPKITAAATGEGGGGDGASAAADDAQRGTEAPAGTLQMEDGSTHAVYTPEQQVRLCVNASGSAVDGCVPAVPGASGGSGGGLSGGTYAAIAMGVLVVLGIAGGIFFFVREDKPPTIVANATVAANPSTHSNGDSYSADGMESQPDADGGAPQRHPLYDVHTYGVVGPAAKGQQSNIANTPVLHANGVVYAAPASGRAAVYDSGELPGGDAHRLRDALMKEQSTGVHTGSSGGSNIQRNQETRKPSVYAGFDGEEEC